MSAVPPSGKRGGVEPPYPTGEQMMAVRDLLHRELQGQVRVGPNLWGPLENRLTDLAWKVLRVAREATMPECSACHGEGRLPCACWPGCPSTYECEACNGAGWVPTDA